MVKQLILRCLPALLLLGGCASLQAPTPTVSPSPTPTSTPAATRYPPYDDGGQFCPPPRAWYEYVAQPGDTLRSLAERTASTISALAAANCLQNPRLLSAGQVVYVPRRIDD